MIPPAVSNPILKGATSMRTMSSNILSFFASNDRSLNSGTISNGFIWIDRFVEFLSVEIIREHLLYSWNTCRSTNQNDFVNSMFVHLGISENLFNWLKSLLEKIHVELLKTRS
mmetsp:Transcript_18771/g.20881  ORF Transcript_18771/g.20881 Transcript_18771/m.20881 type:complete len:113 (-) Transcript_18771:953-1291(-)